MSTKRAHEVGLEILESQVSYLLDREISLESHVADARLTLESLVEDHKETQARRIMVQKAVAALEGAEPIADHNN